ncbi:MAG: hypothetical protein WBV71_07575, partial [Roseobacter sp.]
ALTERQRQNMSQVHQAAKSATETLATSAANGRFSALQPLVLCAANDGSEPNPALIFSCCTRAQKLVFRACSKNSPTSQPKSCRSPKPRKVPFWFQKKKTDEIFAASDLVVFSAASVVNLCNETDIYQRGSKPPPYS